MFVQYLEGYHNSIGEFKVELIIIMQKITKNNPLANINSNIVKSYLVSNTLFGSTVNKTYITRQCNHIINIDINEKCDINTLG